MKAIAANRQQWVYDALGGNTALNRFNARMALRDWDMSTPAENTPAGAVRLELVKGGLQ